ncbi:AtpZ/AtpI family protein [Chloroflexota bacterium]
MSRWIAALRLTGVGFFIGVCIVLGILAGLWVDAKLGTEPVFILAGLVIGVAVAVYGVYRMLLPLIGSKSNKESK